MTQPTDVLERVMREHDALAPDGDAIAARVLAGVDDAPRRRGTPSLVAVGLAAASVAAVIGLAQVGARTEWSDRPQPASPSTQVATDPTPPAPEPDDALLDRLVYRLALGRPGPDGTVTSTLTVSNLSGRAVTDPACLHSANYDYGVVALDRPDAPLRGRVMTKCGGSVDLPAGYVATYDGPAFETRGLEPGDYLATLDFGDARTDRLTAPLTVR